MYVILLAMPKNLAEVVAPRFIGTIFSIVLFGVQAAQARTLKRWDMHVLTYMSPRYTRTFTSPKKGTWILGYWASRANTLSRDRLWLRCLVIALFVAGTVSVVFDTVYVYDALVVNFGQLAWIAR